MRRQLGHVPPRTCAPGTRRWLRAGWTSPGSEPVSWTRRPSPPPSCIAVTMARSAPEEPGCSRLPPVEQPGVKVSVEDTEETPATPRLESAVADGAANRGLGHVGFARSLRNLERDGATESHAGANGGDGRPATPPHSRCHFREFWGNDASPGCSSRAAVPPPLGPLPRPERCWMGVSLAAALEVMGVPLQALSAQ